MLGARGPAGRAAATSHTATPAPATAAAAAVQAERVGQEVVPQGGQGAFRWGWWGVR